MPPEEIPEFHISVGGWGASRRKRELRTGFEQRAQYLLEQAVASDAQWFKGANRAFRQRGRDEPWVLRRSQAVVIVAAVVAIAAFVVSYRSTEGPDKDRFDIAIRMAAVVAALAAGALTWGRLELSRREHRLDVDRELHERYSRCIDQIASEDKFIRIGGLYALERFALDAARLDPAEEAFGDWRLALDVLATLARDLSREVRADDDSAEPRTVIEAVRILGRFPARSGRQDVRSTAHELSTALVGARPAKEPTARTATAHDLAGVVAVGADLNHASFAGSTLVAANLENALLNNAHLVCAELSYMTLAGARLVGAELFLADAVESNLIQADLSRAKLMCVDFRGSDLTGAKLIEADLTNALLDGAVLSGVSARGANLWGASLVGADLRGIHLEGANLADADLTDAILTDVYGDDDTVWPEGYEVMPEDSAPEETEETEETDAPT
jgi:uncharacterized protein YjbI with pentapeptide repeats